MGKYKKIRIVHYETIVNSTNKYFITDNYIKYCKITKFLLLRYYLGHTDYYDFSGGKNYGSGKVTREKFKKLLKIHNSKLGKLFYK